MEGYSEFALSDEEKERGLILACRAVPWEDSEVAWLEEDDLIVHPRRLLDCEVVGLDDATHDIKRMRLKIVSGGPFDFSAGQFASVTFEGCPPRDYSMANVPGDPIAGVPRPPHRGRRHSAPTSPRSSRSATACVSRGRSVPPTCARAIAGRSSPSPAARAWRRSSRSSSGRCSRRCRSTSTSISASAASATSICTTISPALAETHKNLHFMPVLSEGDERRRVRHGLVHEAVAADFDEFDGCKAYLAGPPVMVEAATRLFEQRGMRRIDIHADAFYTAAEMAECGQEDGSGTMTGASGRTCRHRHRRRPRHRPRHRRIAGRRGRQRDRRRQRRLDRRRRTAIRRPARETAAALRQEGDRLHRQRRLARRRQAARRAGGEEFRRHRHRGEQRRHPARRLRLPRRSARLGRGDPQQPVGRRST